MFHEKHHGGDYCTVLYIVLWQTCDKMCQRLSGASDSPTLSDSLAQTTLKSQRLSGANSYKKIVLNIMTVLHTVIMFEKS